MGRIGLAIALILGLIGGWWTAQPPAPLPADAPASAFSAGRAMADVRAIAIRPHPAGSAEIARVRDVLLGRLRALGLEVRAQLGVSLRVRDADGEQAADGADVINLIGVMAGRDRAAPAVLVMAHYDSVPGSPGAADDGAGVAAVLEIARALRADGQPARDVIFLLTDAEENGLHGARAFFASDPLRTRPGFVINMDVRGDAGRAVMHETGPDAGATIELYARAVAQPTADSIAAEVKKAIRNNTDFAIAAERGLQGVNFSFLGNQFDYHAASSTAATLDRGSLQHMGAQALAMARATAQAPALPRSEPDKAYASLLGLVTIAYPPWVGWVFIAAAAGLMMVAWRQSARPKPMAIARAALIVLLMTLALALAIHLLRIGTGAPYGFTPVRPLLARWSWFESAVAAICIAFMIGLFTRFRAEPLGDALPFGLFGLLAIVAVAGQALAPAAMTLIEWTLLASAALILAAPRLRGPLTPLIALLAVPVLAQILATAHLVLLTIGENAPEVAAIYTLLVTLTLAPLLARAGQERGTAAVAVAGLVAAIAIVLAIRTIDYASPARPRASQVVYVGDVDAGRFWRVSSLATIDRWTEAALTADGGRIAEAEMKPLYDHVSRADARAVALAAPATTMRRLPGGRILISVAPDPQVRDLRVRLLSSAAVRRATINGVVAPGLLADPRQPATVSWITPRAGLTILLETGSPGQLTAVFSALRDGWPRDATPLPPRDPGTMPWYNSDSRVAMWSLAVK